MATTTKSRTDAKDGHSPVEYLQDALDGLVKARDEAGGDIRSGIETAIDRTRDAIREAGSETQEQLGDWRRSIERASDDLRQEFGVMAVRAQRSPKALKAISVEVKKRKAELDS